MGELFVTFVEPEAAGATLRLLFEQVAGKHILRSASASPGGASIPGLEQLAAFAVALDDAAFLVEEARLRLQSAFLRQKEVAQLSEQHLVFDQNGVLRVTFPSGVMATIETGPDYPLGAGTVRLANIETMGVFSDNLQTARGLLSDCKTLTDYVQVLAAKFGAQKKK